MCKNMAGSVVQLMDSLTNQNLSLQDKMSEDTYSILTTSSALEAGQRLLNKMAVCGRKRKQKEEQTTENQAGWSDGNCLEQVSMLF